MFHSLQEQCLLHSSSYRARAAGDCTGHVTWLDWFGCNIERVTAHRIKGKEHSCFHNHWTTSKLNSSLRAMGTLWCFRALHNMCTYREDQLCTDLFMIYYDLYIIFSSYSLFSMYIWIQSLQCKQVFILFMLILVTLYNIRLHFLIYIYI